MTVSSVCILVMVSCSTRKTVVLAHICMKLCVYSTTICNMYGLLSKFTPNECSNAKSPCNACQAVCSRHRHQPRREVSFFLYLLVRFAATGEGASWLLIHHISPNPPAHLPLKHQVHLSLCQVFIRMICNQVATCLSSYRH